MATLHFDCALGVLAITDSQGTYTVRATSGTGACMNNPRCRNIPWQGPIPAGTYCLFRSEISNPSVIGDIYRNLRYGNWGDWRVPLRNMNGGPVNSGRGGFYIHSGFIEGSAGCINIGWSPMTVRRVLRSIEEAEWSALWVE